MLGAFLSWMKIAGNKIMMVSKSRFKKFHVGDCMLLAVPKVDRGPAHSQNLVSVNSNEKNGKNQVDYTKEISLSEAIKKISGGKDTLNVRADRLLSNAEQGNVSVEL